MAHHRHLLRHLRRPHALHPLAPRAREPSAGRRADGRNVRRRVHRGRHARWKEGGEEGFKGGLSPLSLCVWAMANVALRVG